MASGGHILATQKGNVETRLKTLTNPNLKDICRAYGKNVSGNKADLQKRCLEVLEDAISTGDVQKFDELSYRASHRGEAPPSNIDLGVNHYGSPAGGYSNHPMPPARPNAAATQNRLPGGGHVFKFRTSPFYEIIETVLPMQDLPEGPEMPHNRNTVRAQVNLTNDQCLKIATEDMRLMMYCGPTFNMGQYTHSPVDVTFPNQIEVKINEDDLKHNFKGLKNKPGSTKPADITKKVRAKPNYPNQISVTYALTTKRYAYAVYLARYVSADRLAERLKSAKIIPKQQVIDEMNKANADPDIEATSTRMSLKDPISTVRIAIPVRSTVCSHNQCFDGSMFLQMMEQAPVWNCPVCTKAVSFESLCVDKYFEDILNNTSKSIEKVDVEPNGEWRVIKEEEDQQQQANGTSSKPRASYDDDFDDDLLEVPEPTNKVINGIKQDSQPPSMLSPFGAQSFPMNTPPLSSREPSVAQSTASLQRAGNKRPSSAVIDLTLSDDEDEQPPRPAKRQQTTTSQSQTSQSQNRASGASAGSSSSYHTPASLPDRNNGYQPYPQPPRQADNYRPSTYSAAPPRSPLLQHGRFASPSNPQSPLRPSSNYSGAPAASGSWPAHHSRPPSNGLPSAFQPFAIRPPASPGGSSLQNGDAGGMRLPPMQTHPPQQQHQPSQQYQEQSPFNGYSGWRSDGSYSNSPG